MELRDVCGLDVYIFPVEVGRPKVVQNNYKLSSGAEREMERISGAQADEKSASRRDQFQGSLRMRPEY